MSRPKGEDDALEVPRPVDAVAALAEALRKLQALPGDRALIGGVAMAVYGIERFTKAVDLAVTVSQTSAVEQQLKGDDPQPLKIGGVSIATSSGVRVDLVDRRQTFRALYEEAIQAAMADGPLVKAEDQRVRVVTLPYLIALKMAADRPQDELDLQGLLAMPALDYRSARAIVEKHLGVFAMRRLDRMARAIGRADAPADYENGTSKPS